MYREFGIHEFYHIFDRGVEKRDIFLTPLDYIRFIHDLYEFNDTQPAPDFNQRYKPSNMGGRTSQIATPSKESEIIVPHSRKLLIRLHGYVLMPNHHHLLPEQLVDGGISLFMRKLHSGYATAFNVKYKHSGHLFQGTYKSVHVKTDRYLAHFVCYMHANPLDIWKKDWKEKGLTDKEIEEALSFLETYRWSSHLDYLGEKNFPSVIDMHFLGDFFRARGGYKKFFTEWLRQYKENINSIENIVLK